MSSFFNDLMTGLNEAVAIEQEKLKGRRTVYEIQPVKKYNNVQIKQIRASVGMTQAFFADYMGVSTKTVESWEKGTNHPTGAACRLISMLENKTFEALPFVHKMATVQ
ncbi:helix-turn-helix domain-containing protein [uncultured Treponema sp.]|uniref:helix-turn-helix domain-containing protein n=1 Tax=uncultured Treponema sp. TaxID=162155 RepID=UPI0025F76B8F|nr:helix-turn-helix domain-containing protein [uncultured Treponema sp.]